MTQKDFYKIVNYIKQIISGSEYENHVYSVAGAVRDLLMNNEIKDIDLVIDLQDGGIRFVNWLYKLNLLTHEPVVYPTYGTAMCIFKDFPDIEIECVQTRKEQYKNKNSRNPETTYGTIFEDSIRRDLTINSLYYNISSGEIIDPTGKGKEDILGHVIRVTNDNPDVVFIDDPLRILRVCRFSTRYGWGIEHETYKSMVRNVDRLSIITHERIRDEFQKILLSKNATMGIRMLVDIGAMKYIIPEFIQTVGMTQNKFHFGDVYEHTLALIDYYHNHFEPDVICLLACLLHDIGKINTRTVGEDGRVHFYEHENETELVENILRNLKYDNETIKEVCFIIKNHMRTKNFGNDCVKIKPKNLNKLIYTCHTKERYEKLCMVIECDNMSHHPDYIVTGQYDYFMKQMDNKMFSYRLPINGNDIMSYLNIDGGKEIKFIMDKLIKQAFNNPDINKEQCLKQLPSLLKQVKNEMKNKN